MIKFGKKHFLEVYKNLDDKKIFLKTKKNAEEVINEIFSSLQKIIKREKKCKLYNFGTFRVSHMNEKTTRNPKTGEKVIVKERDVVRFKEQKPHKKNERKEAERKEQERRS